MSTLHDKLIATRLVILIMSFFTVVGCATTVQDVMKYKQRGDVEKLTVVLLNEDNIEIKREAAKALGEIKAVEPLIAALKDENANVRKSAALRWERLKMYEQLSF